MAAQWLKLRNERRATSNGAYVNVENGSRLGVREYSYNGTKWEIWMKLGQAQAETLADGYADEAEALSALDEFTAEHEIYQLQIPVSQQERIEAEVNGNEIASDGFLQPDGSVIHKSPEEVK